MNTQHTPGPWIEGRSQRKDGPLSHIVPILAPDIALVVAHVNDCTGVGNANAALIAAAPELLAALAEAAPWLERALTDEPDDYDNHELRAVVEQIRAALSRIEAKS